MIVYNFIEQRMKTNKYITLLNEKETSQFSSATPNDSHEEIKRKINDVYSVEAENFKFMLK